MSDTTKEFHEASGRAQALREIDLEIKSFEDIYREAIEHCSKLHAEYSKETTNFFELKERNALRDISCAEAVLENLKKLRLYVENPGLRERAAEGLRQSIVRTQEKDVAK